MCAFSPSPVKQLWHVSSDMVEVSDGKDWLSATLKSIDMSGLVGKAKRLAVYQAMMVSHQFASSSKHHDEVGLYEEVLLAASRWLGQACGITNLIRRLQQAGHLRLVSRLRKLAKVRNSLAHPDVALLSDVISCLQGVSCPAQDPSLREEGTVSGSDEQSSGGFGDDTGSSNDFTRSPDDKQFFIGDELVSVDTQTDATLCNTMFLDSRQQALWWLSQLVVAGALTIESVQEFCGDYVSSLDCKELGGGILSSTVVATISSLEYEAAFT